MKACRAWDSHVASASVSAELSSNALDWLRGT